MLACKEAGSLLGVQGQAEALEKLPNNAPSS